MQQLQGTYRGDQSDTLAQILGLDYDPQNYLAQMAQQMLSTGMSSSTQLKTAAMQQEGQNNREFLARQYEMNKLRKEQSELRNAATAGLRGRQSGIISSLGAYMDMLDPDDPYAKEEAAAMQKQIAGLQNAFNQGGSLAERAATLQAIMETGLTEPTVAGGMVTLKRKGQAQREAAKKAAEAPAADKAKAPEQESSPEDIEINLDENS